MRYPNRGGLSIQKLFGKSITSAQGIAGLINPDCNPIYWIGICQFCHFNPNPKLHNYFIKKFKFHSASCIKKNAKLLFIKILKQ